MSVDFVLASRVVGGNSHSGYGDGVGDSNLIHFGAAYSSISRPRVFDSNLVAVCLPCAPIHSSARTVYQQIPVVQGGIVACVAQFCRS